MSNLPYTTYPHFGQKLKESYHYSQAVRLGSTVHCSGQGGWDAATGQLSRDTGVQVAQAFKMVDVCLRDAGVAKGWGAVYKVRTYHVPLNDEAVELLVKGLKEWCPEHEPVLTVLGVARLGFDDMKIEIEVEAYDG
ncbi:MAG: hypothetical protein Q9162_000955 [Coniocarpon cinnabarinum]